MIFRRMSFSKLFAAITPVLLTTVTAFGQNSQSPAAASSKVVALKIMSSNVRYGTANDGENAWPVRKELLRDCWREQGADIVGTQEMLPFQAQYLVEQLPEYQYVGRSREPENADGEQCGIFFRRSRFFDLEQGHLWLSETPEMPGSRGWDAALPRMATWIKLYDRESGKPLIVVNTHFDHRGEEARRQSGRLLHRQLRRWAGEYPLIVTGDFNCGDDSPAYASLLQTVSLDSSDSSRQPALIDTFRVANPNRTQSEGTFGGFQGDRQGSRIDWILVSPPLKVRAAEIIYMQRDGHYPSDHYPVTATLDW